MPIPKLVWRGTATDTLSAKPESNERKARALRRGYVQALPTFEEVSALTFKAALQKCRAALCRLLKKILGEGSSPSPTSFLRAFSWSSRMPESTDLLAFGHTSPLNL